MAPGWRSRYSSRIGRVTSSHSQRSAASPPPSASWSASRWPSQYVLPGTWLGRISSAVVHGSVTPSLAHTMSTVSSAIRRNVVILPPTIVTKFSTPSWPRGPDGMRPRDLAAILRRGRGHLGGWLVERPHAGVGAQEPHLPEVGEELLALADQGRHLVARDLVLVRVLHALFGRAQDGDRVNGHHDVAVGGLVAAVDDRVGHALVVDEHRALAGVHRDGHADHRGNLPGPGARARDDEPGRDAGRAPGALVADGRRDDPLALCAPSPRAAGRTRPRSRGRGRPRCWTRSGSRAPRSHPAALNTRRIRRLRAGSRRNASWSGTSSQSTSAAAQAAAKPST